LSATRIFAASSRKRRALSAGFSTLASAASMKAIRPTAETNQ